MKYLVACDHARQIFDCANEFDARARFTCKRCVKFDLKAERFVYKDVRMYRASAEDEKGLSAGVINDGKRSKDLAKLDQVDWVNDSNWVRV